MAEGLLPSQQKPATLMVQCSELWKMNEHRPSSPTAARGSGEQSILRTGGRLTTVFPLSRSCDRTGEFNCKDILQERIYERTGEQIELRTSWKDS